jgi:hypothetical protein
MAETLLTVDVERYGQKFPKVRLNGQEDCWRSFLEPKDRGAVESFTLINTHLVSLTLELSDQDGGVDIRHTITAGWAGPWRLPDTLFRLYFSPRFAAVMDEHVRTEFPIDTPERGIPETTQIASASTSSKPATKQS